MAAPWDYISPLSTTEQNPIRCYYVTAGDITLSSPGRSGHTERAGRGRPGRAACERPAGPAALSPLLLLPRGNYIISKITTQDEVYFRTKREADREG